MVTSDGFGPANRTHNMRLKRTKEPATSIAFAIDVAEPLHLFLNEWKAAFPKAKLYAPPGLRAKRPDLCFDEDLGDQPNPTGVAQFNR